MPRGSTSLTWLPVFAGGREKYRHHPWTQPGGWEAAEYPSRPMIEQQMWRKHYSNSGGAPGGGGGGRGGRGNGRGGGGVGIGVDAEEEEALVSRPLLRQ